MRSTLAAAAIFAVVAVGSARGESKFLVADADPLQDSYFTLDFGKMGGVAEALISQTYYILELDGDAGTAGFLTYHQEIDELILPGGISTGALTIEIVEGSSSGTYDVSTGIFTTEEVYLVYFEGDLSMFGIESPFVLPSTSTGVVTHDTYVTGGVSMEWAGEDELYNPSDPKSPLTFSYTCDVSAQFAHAATGDFDADTRVDFSDYLVWRSCYTGSGEGPVGSACAAGDFDIDGDIDRADLAGFRAAYTGS